MSPVLVLRGSFPCAKTNQSRCVVLDEVGVAVLTAHRARVLAWAAQAGVEVQPDAFVFSPFLEAATPLRPDNVTSFFIRARDSVGADGEAERP